MKDKNYNYLNKCRKKIEKIQILFMIKNSQPTGNRGNVLNIITAVLKKKKKRFLSKYYCSLTVYLVTQELGWKCTKRFMLFSCLLTQHPFCSPWNKE